MKPTTERIRDSKTFTRLNAEFVLGRRIKYFLMNLYIPSTMCVLVSWISFWIKVEIAPARVTLGVTTFLAISGKFELPGYFFMLRVSNLEKP